MLFEKTGIPVVRAEGVRFTYDGESYALNGIDLTVPEGQFLCILGGNGSGKSTLARILSGLLVPDEGLVSVFGQDTRSPEGIFAARAATGIVFQKPDDQLIASIVEEDVAFGPENLGLSPEEIAARVDEALGIVGLQGFQKREVSSLSGGQKQRVAIAGALAMHPDLLILDEASAMLDPQGRAGLMRVIHRLNAKGMAIVMITHFMDEAAEADRIVVLDNGSKVLDGTPKQVLSQREVLSDLGLDVPFPVKLSWELQQCGVPVGTVFDAGELKEELCRLALNA